MKKTLLIITIATMLFSGCEAKPKALAGEPVDPVSVSNETEQTHTYSNPGGLAIATEPKIHVFSNHSGNMELAYLNVDDGIARKISNEKVYWICKDDSWVYFSAMDEDVAKLFQITADGEAEELFAEVDAWNPAVYNGWIYYQDGGANYALARINISSKEVQKLNEARNESYCIWDDKIYFSDYNGETINVMNLDGSDSQVKFKGRAYGISGGAKALWYKSSYGTVYEYRKDLKEPILKHESGAAFIHTGGKNNTVAYIVDEQGVLYQIKDDVKSVISPEGADVADIYAFDNWVYYRDMNDHGNLYRLDVDTLKSVAVGLSE